MTTRPPDGTSQSCPPAVNRAGFFREMSADTPFYQLFDLLPGVSFFAKDRHFRIVGANRLFWERFGFSAESEIIGKTDFDLFPARLAENFRRDDESVLSSGEPKTRIVELFFNRQGLPDWYVTSKWPIKNTTGALHGIMGIVQSYQTRQQILDPFVPIQKAVRHIREQYQRPVSIRELAAMENLSERQLHRKFQEAFGIGPQAFLLKTRVQAACDMLRAEVGGMGSVALDCGFSDQSAFCRQFRKQMGITPLRYHKTYRGNREKPTRIDL